MVAFEALDALGACRVEPIGTRAFVLRSHGVMPLEGQAHPLRGTQRINSTFRKAGWRVQP